MENEFNDVSPELAPKPKRRSRRSKKAAAPTPEVTKAPEVLDVPEVHYAALYESLEETKVEEPVVEPEPTPEPESTPEPEPTPEPVVVPVRPRRQQLVRPMKKKQPPASGPGRRQRKAI